MSVPLYDDLSSDYDRFVNWPARLAAELPFLEAQLATRGARRVLDVAAGTGRHAIALARAGYSLAAADLSAGMVARARQNAAEADVALDLAVAGFGVLRRALPGPFDAVLCLGNSLPHALDDAALSAALADMAAVLRPGGLLLLQLRNFAPVLAERRRFMPPETQREGDREWLFFRFYDFEAPLLQFHVLRLYRQGAEPWQTRLGSTPLRPWLAGDLLPALSAAGFGTVTRYGNLRGEPYDPAASSDLVLLAERG
jgi:glycine/sarcosine N-methyltransferase